MAAAATRTTIPASLRRWVWNRYIGEAEGKGPCFCCNTGISQGTFQSGHVQSDADGGKTVLGNLRPICSECNQSMGKKNMIVFAVQWGFQLVEEAAEKFGCSVASIQAMMSGTPSTPKLVPEPPPKAEVEVPQAAEAHGPSEEKTAAERPRAELRQAAAEVLGRTRVASLGNERASLCVLKGNDFATLRAALDRWDDNRELVDGRAQKLAQVEKELHLNTGRYEFSITPVVVGQLGLKYYLLDGQHRARAWDLLGRPADTEWVVHVVVCASREAVEQTFLWVNSGTPVPSAYFDKRIRAALTDFLDMLEREYPSATSTTKAPHRPRYNRELKRDEMSSYNPLRDALMDKKLTPEDLLSAALEINQEQANRYANDKKARDRQSKKCYETAEKMGFYLGLDVGWPITVAIKAIGKITPEGG